MNLACVLKSNAVNNRETVTASGIAAIIRKGLRFPYLVSMLSETNPVIGPQKASQIGPAAAMVPAKAGSIPATDVKKNNR